jgi:myo-inositol-1(or 4)-monophosphatase
MTDVASVPAPGAPDPRALLALARATAVAAGDLLVEGLERSRSRVATKTSVTDVVTEMDEASERLIHDALLAVRPHDGFIGEEGTDRPGTSGVRWVVDPIDGTTNYLYGHPGFNVSIAAEVAGRVVAGVVVDPLHGDTFAAVEGEGATRNDRPIEVSGETRLSHALVATGFSYDAARRHRQALVLARVLGEVRDIRRVGAAAVDLCSVACGRVDAFYERSLQPWDYAAGALIATEAGAVVGDLDGGPLSPRFALAAAPGVFEPLRALLAAAGAGDA